MRLRHVYMVLSILGVLLPYALFIPWVVQYGFDLAHFWHQLFANQIGGFFGMDVIVSALALWIFVFSEGWRLSMKHLWLPVVATLIVGVSLGLPLFLYMRQVRLDQLAE